MLRNRWVCAVLLAAAATAFGAPALVGAETESKSKPAKVDLNSATEKELEDLPGVGPATAEKIIAGRPYASVSDLEKAGVSAKTIAEIKPLVTVKKTKSASSSKADTASKESASASKDTKSADKSSSSGKSSSSKSTAKVDVNSATEKELEDLPGVGPATAQKIIAGRPYASVADLEKAGVSAKTLEEIKPLVTAKKVKATPSASASTASASSSKSATKSTSSKPAETAPKATASTKAAEEEEVEARTPPRPGLVWVNTESKIYHVEGDRWYGKTKKGEWMTEAEAQKAGYRPVKEPEPKKENQ